MKKESDIRENTIWQRVFGKRTEAPNPVEWPRLHAWSPRHRRLRCDRYDGCLTLAARKQWGGFSCLRCKYRKEIKGMSAEKVFWVPLQQARMCVNCDVVFGFEPSGSCPVCGESGDWVFLTQWVKEIVKTKRQKREEAQDADGRRDESERNAEDAR
jgi:hypothetical protein